jgi:hypothetical protein
MSTCWTSWLTGAALAGPRAEAGAASEAMAGPSAGAVVEQAVSASAETMVSERSERRMKHPLLSLVWAHHRGCAAARNAQ